MENGEEDNLEWFKETNPSISSTLQYINNLGNPSVPENQQFVSPASLYSPEHQFYHFSSPSPANLSMPENRHRLSNPEINHYQYQQPIVHANPSFYDSLYDLEADFDYFNILTPSRDSPGPSSDLGYAGGRFRIDGSTLQNNSPIGSSASMGYGYPPISYDPAEYTDLQRLRVQVAVRGQISQRLEQHSLNPNSLPHNPYNNNGVRNLAPAMNTYPRTTSPHSNQNGFQSSSDYNTPHYIAPTNSNQNGFRGISSSSSTITTTTNRFEAGNSQPLQQQQQRPAPTLLELRGMMFLVAKDKRGSVFLQKKIQEAKQEEIDMIFCELKDCVRELMVDQFGNSLMQKFFGVCNQYQITQMLLSVISDERHFMSICCDTHGTRAMQKLLDQLITKEQRSLLMPVLGWITVNLSNHSNGNHVIKHCLKNFSNEDNMHILRELAENCVDIAMDKAGCCVLQYCLQHSGGEPVNRLLAKIVANALVLSESRFGNYVVQYALAMKLPHVKADILAQLAGNYVSLSMNKYSSNVVERCLKESGEDQAEQIIKEIINSRNFLMLLQDPYGNFVAQSALAVSKGAVRQTLVGLIQKHYPFLHSHPYGKRVLSITRGSKLQQHVFACKR